METRSYWAHWLQQCSAYFLHQTSIYLACILLMDRKGLLRSYNDSCRVTTMGFGEEFLLDYQSLSTRWGIPWRTIYHWKITGLWQRDDNSLAYPVVCLGKSLFQYNPEDMYSSVTPAQSASSYFHVSYLPQNDHLNDHLRYLSVTQGTCEMVQWPHESCKIYLVVESLVSHTAAVYPSWGPFFVHWHELPLHGGLSINPWSLSKQLCCWLIIIIIDLFISLK